MSSVAMDLQRFNIADAAIATMAEEYLPLTIADVNDVQGADAVHKARMNMKNRRCDVERTRVSLKADALEYGRTVDAEARRITGLMAPIEDHLAKQESANEAAKEAIRNEARLKAEAEERAKREAEEARLKAERDAEDARIRAERAAEAERLRIEREKLDAERKAMEVERAKIAEEQAAERARQKAEQDKIDAETRRLAAIETARLRKIEDERIAAEAAERAKIETEKRIARETAEKKAAEEAKEAARIKAAALRPDREKLLTVAAALGLIPSPSMSSAEGWQAKYLSDDIIGGAVLEIQAIVDQLLPAEATNANH